MAPRVRRLLDATGLVERRGVLLGSPPARWPFRKMSAASSSRSMLQVNALLVASVGVGFANNVAIAWMFGLTRSVDAYYAAMLLPGLFMVLFIEYLGKNFLPVFARSEEHTSE